MHSNLTSNCNRFRDIYM